jgi:hypothetical protein
MNRTRSSTTRRVVSALNLTLAPTDKLQLFGNFSNFFTNTLINQLDVVDSVRFTQVTIQAGAGANYTLKRSTTVSHTLMAQLQYQQANDNQTNSITDGKVGFYNANLGYVYNFMPLRFTANLALNYTENTLPTLTTRSMGPVVGLTKGLYKNKARLMLNGTWLPMWAANQSAGSTTNIRAGLNYTLTGGHSLVGSVMWIQRKSGGTVPMASFTETRVNCGYQYNF